MTRNKLAIIGGSGLYDVEEFTERELIDSKKFPPSKSINSLVLIFFLNLCSTK